MVIFAVISLKGMCNFLAQGMRVWEWRESKTTTKITSNRSKPGFDLANISLIYLQIFNYIYHSVQYIPHTTLKFKSLF